MPARWKAFFLFPFFFLTAVKPFPCWSPPSPPGKCRKSLNPPFYSEVLARRLRGPPPPPPSPFGHGGRVSYFPGRERECRFFPLFSCTDRIGNEHGVFFYSLSFPFSIIRVSFLFSEEEGIFHLSLRAFGENHFRLEARPRLFFLEMVGRLPSCLWETLSYPCPSPSNHPLK